VSGVLLAAGLFTGCNHDGPTDPLSRVHQLQSVDNAPRLRAGTQYILRVRAVDADGNAVTGAPVEWTASAGLLESADSRSSTDGIAARRWTAPAELGGVTVTATAGGASLSIAIEVVPGAATRLDIVEDSVRFTAQGQKRIVRAVGWDQFGHPAALETDRPSASSTVASVTGLTPIGDTAYVELTSAYGTHMGYAYVTAAGGVGRDSVRIISEPVVVGIQKIAGLDSVNGLVIGEKAQLEVTGLDSLGHPVANVDVTAAGLQLSSSDPNVATTSNDGIVTAVAAGAVTIDAAMGGVTYHVTVTVYPVFDVGTRMSSVELHDPMAYFQEPLGYSLTDAGTSYDLSHYIGAGAPPHPESVVLRATAIDGKVPWTRSYPGNSAAAVADPASGVVYLADPLHVMHAIAPAGTDRWTFDSGAIDAGYCRLAGWKDGVAAACGTHAFALNGDGSLAWSATVSDVVLQIITTPALTILRSIGSVSAVADNGSISWTVPSASTDMIADANSTVYLVEGGVRAIDVAGVERWHNPTPLAGCVLATADRLVVCRNNRVITALDRTDGQVRWTATSPTSFGSIAAIAGDRLLLSNAFMFALDARSGAILGRSMNRMDEVYVTVGDGVMAASSVSSAIVFHTSLAPGSEWSQTAANAGHDNRVTP
jgi:hypothetical protein